MDGQILLPGFRFCPTDVQLCLYYLKRKIMGKTFPFEVISEVEIYKFAPQDLPDKSSWKSKDLEWYFFCPADKKYANSLRKNRANGIGCWKTTGKDRSVSHGSQTVAWRRTLIFHEGRGTESSRTNWVMHEYRLDEKELADSGFSPDAYVVCKIYQKSGTGPKIGEQYGAPFSEEDWEDDSSVLLPSICDESMHAQNAVPFCVQPMDHAMDRAPSILSERADMASGLQESPESNLETSTTQASGMCGSQLSFPGDAAEGGIVYKEQDPATEGGMVYEEQDPATEGGMVYEEQDPATDGDACAGLEHDLLGFANSPVPTPTGDVHLPCSTNGIVFPPSEDAYMEMSDFLLYDLCFYHPGPGIIDQPSPLWDHSSYINYP